MQNDLLQSLIPDITYLRELYRPWKLITFSAAMVWLVYGAIAYNISDWDVGVCFVMGGLTYACAPWSVELIRRGAREREKYSVLQIIASLLLAVINVDTVYWIYHTLVGNQMLRLENFKVSMALYYICGIGWYYRGSLKELFSNLRHLSSN